MNIDNIIANNGIYTVFKAVFSLRSAGVEGYEALSRIEPGNFDGSVRRLFHLAEQEGKIWLLDKFCRKNAIKIARGLGLKKKLFLNVDKLCLLQNDFKAGWTKTHAEKMGFEAKSVVIKISADKTSSKSLIKETDGVDEDSLLEDAVRYYKSQQYLMAISTSSDDISELKKIAALDPDYIFLEENVTDSVCTYGGIAFSFLELERLCKASGIKLVFCGIQDEDILSGLLKQNSAYGQGDFLSKEQRALGKISRDAYANIVSVSGKNIQEMSLLAEEKKLSSKKIIKKFQLERKAEVDRHSVSAIMQRGCVCGAEILISDVLKFFKKDESLTVVSVVDSDRKVLGILPRVNLFRAVGSQYGYGLYGKKKASEMMIQDFLSVEETESTEKVARLSMQRSDDHLYDPILVEKNGLYRGIVNVKDLLDSMINVEVLERTQELNKKNRLLLAQEKIQAQDMKMAELVQKSIYPSKAPATKKWDCSFFFKPMASVSGDVYNFYYDAQNELEGVSLFDVSGHGVASGLVGILSKYIAEEVFAKKADKDLAGLLKSFNKKIIKEKGSAENYLTGIFLRFKAGQVEYVNAGHTDVLVLKDGKTNILGQDENAAENNDDFRGTFLGIDGLPDTYKPVKLPLVKGAYYILFTDGLTESRNLSGDELGIDMLKKILARTEKDLPAKKLLSYLMDIFFCWTEAVPVKDDLTVIVMRYLG